MRRATSMGPTNPLSSLPTSKSRALKPRYTANLWRFPGGVFNSSCTHSYPTRLARETAISTDEPKEFPALPQSLRLAGMSRPDSPRVAHRTKKQNPSLYRKARPAGSARALVTSALASTNLGKVRPTSKLRTCVPRCRLPLTGSRSLQRTCVTCIAPNTHACAPLTFGS